MKESGTRLQHTCPTEGPFDCMSGDLSDQGFLVVVDKRTHELVVEEDDDETVRLAVNPKGVQVQRPTPRPGTRMLDLDASSSDPARQAAESIERLRRDAKEPEPFHVSEAELAETRARLKREAEANRPRYQAQDAALSALGKEEYRVLLEAVLAGHIADAAADADPADPEDARLLQYEINGLCIALRLLGGYEVWQEATGTERVAFDLNWARAAAPVSFDWRGFLGYSIEEQAKFFRGCRGGIGTPRDEQSRVLPDSED